MANRRMFSKIVIDTDEFLDMPPTTQNLYFHFGMRADDDGFVSSPKKIMKITNAATDDMNVLIAKRFIIPFQKGVCVIRHWGIHNLIRKDRYTETEYLQEKDSLMLENGKYEPKGFIGKPNGNQMEPQVRLGKVKLGKDNNTAFEQFYSAYPKKVSKVSALKAFKRLNPSATLLQIIRKDIQTRKKSAQWKDKQFIPYPATYLNQKRWEDDYIEPEPEKKPYFNGNPVYGEKNNRTVKVDGEFKTFAGSEKDIEWK